MFLWNKSIHEKTLHSVENTQQSMNLILNDFFKQLPLNSEKFKKNMYFSCSKENKFCITNVHSIKYIGVKNYRLFEHIFIYYCKILNDILLMIFTILLIINLDFSYCICVQEHKISI